MKKDYQTKAAPAATEQLVMPDTVTLDMADLAETVKEGLLALAVGAGFAASPLRPAPGRCGAPQPSGACSATAYVGRVYYNRTESVPDPRPGRSTRQVPRAREDWIEIPVPAIIAEDVFEAAGRVSRDNSKWSPRNADDGAWLLRALVRCGACNVGVSCHKMKGRNGEFHRYYYCRNHDPLRAGGEDRRCRERNIRSDALDVFVFDQVREALLRPEITEGGSHRLAEAMAGTGVASLIDPAPPAP